MTGEPDGPDASARAAGAPLRILLAEDSAIGRKLVSRLLEARGHTVVAAEDGAAALACLREGPFDLVLMDIEMPRMDGVEAAAQIRRRQTDAGLRLPIVALSAHDTPGDRERFLRAGMDDTLAKPIDREALFRVVERVQAQRAAGRPAAPPLFQRAEALERLEGDLELLREVAGLLRRDLPQLRRRIEDGWRRRDVADLRLAVHSLKGMVSAFTTGPLLARVRDLEALTKALAPDWEAWGRLRGDVEGLLDQLLIELREQL